MEHNIAPAVLLTTAVLARIAFILAAIYIFSNHTDKIILRSIIIEGVTRKRFMAVLAL